MVKTFEVRFWGARGTLASTSTNTQKYGGNTSCIEITCGEDTLIFDAGSGLKPLGDKLAGDSNGNSKRLHLFFTHCHYDHISALPFFAPLFDPNCSIDIWSGHLPGPNKTENMIKEYMKSPYFPVGPDVFSAKISYGDFEPFDTLTPVPNVKIDTHPLNHHDGCIGYRVNFDGRSICFITDTTHIPDKPDEALIEFVRGSDLMIYDASYTDAEFPQFWNFGHSTWEEGVRICNAANVKRYCIFHHRPSRNDDALDAVLATCKTQFENSSAAYEGLVIKV